MSTLPPPPSFNQNIPVLTSAGGTSAAYKNPNSPESIMKKTAELQAQTAVDSTFDVAQSPYHEGFTSPASISLLLYLIIIIFIAIVVFDKMRVSAKLFMLVIAVSLVIFVIGIYSRNG